ncbi:MAG: bifunctional DNA primase/polymerase [Desulfobacterales bacterium]|nr:MAG: bifunctional DNA primase/polymerase [Desulfobacterales bacterium]
MSKNLSAAVKYMQNGFSVIPIKTNKQPYIKWQPYQRKCANENQIRQWWGKWPRANIGIVTGQVSGIIAIDADSQDGQDALYELIPEAMELPIAKTPRGYHNYFAYQPGLRSGPSNIKDCDIKSDGGYVIAPPSNNDKGQSYTWLPNLRITDVKPQPMPDILFDTLQQVADIASAYSSTHLNKIGGYKEPQKENKTERQHSSTFVNKVNISFNEPGRDVTLFHLAHHLVKSGMPRVNIEKYLEFFASHCLPPFTEKEKKAKIKSAFDRSEKQNINLTQTVKEFIASTSVNISSTEIYLASTSSTFPTPEERRKISAILSRLIKEGFIERVGDKSGLFRKVENECDEIDFINADTRILPIKWPFDIQYLVEIMPGNIIVVAGEADAGKTAFLLNVIQQNMNQFEIHYFNSEMGDSELKKRLMLFNRPLDKWKFKPWERSDNFSDVIKPGKGKINIVDFLEIYESFYEVGGKLAEIHKKLNGAVAIVAIQKNPGVEVGLGGYRGMEKPRLYLTMSRDNICKIVKGKNWATAENPNKKEIKYKIVNGCDIYPQGGWHKPIL